MAAFKFNRKARLHRTSIAQAVGWGDSSGVDHDPRWFTWLIGGSLGAASIASGLTRYGPDLVAESLRPLEVKIAH